MVPLYTIDAYSTDKALKVGNFNSWFEVLTGGNTRLGFGDGSGHEAAYISAFQNASGKNTLSFLGVDDFGNSFEGITLQEDGRVGIGMDTPSSETKVHIETSSDNFGVLVDAAGNAGSEIGLHAATTKYSSMVKNAYYNGSWYRFDTSSGAFLQEVNPAGDVRFRTAPSGSGAISWRECLALTSGGNVGVGTTNPSTNLHVYDSSSDAILTLSSGAGSRWEVQSTSSGAFEIVDRDAGENRIIVHPSGKVGIGTAIEPPGGTKLAVMGDVYCGGKMSSSGGYDPPYVLYDNESRDAIIKRVAEEVPEDKLDGAALFWNGARLQFEVYLPEQGEFRDLQGNLLEKLQ
jgi:hypothetical protein